jgi:hypothetical protein
LNHVLHGKPLERQTEGERQQVFENLSIATAEVGEQKETRAGKAGDGADRPTPMRAIGNQPRVEGDQTHP